MSTCLVIADAARARFCATIDPHDDDSGRRLVEHDDFVNPDGQLTGSELFENLKSGRKRVPDVGANYGPGSAHGLDDHRARHERELTRRFARRVAEATARYLADQRATQLVVVAAPRALGSLRGALREALPPETAVVEIASDLSSQPLPAIEDVLEQHGIVEPRPFPEDRVFRPAGQPPPKSS